MLTWPQFAVLDEQCLIFRPPFYPETSIGSLSSLLTGRSKRIQDPVLRVRVSSAAE